MIKINIKPLSINECWQGRRYKTARYNNYTKELYYKLPGMIIDKSRFLELSIIVGFSNSNADLDNIVKPLQDIMQKKWGFNDKKILDLHVSKWKAKKGEEFIAFELKYSDRWWQFWKGSKIIES